MERWAADRAKRPEGALLLQKACLFTADEAHQRKLHSFMDDPLDVIPVARRITADVSRISTGETVISVELSDVDCNDLSHLAPQYV